MNSGAITDTPWLHCRLYLSVPAFAAVVLTLTYWQLPGHSLLWRELQNTGHTLLFGILALLALCSYGAVMPATRHRPIHGYLAAGSACLLTGVAVELVQLVSGGDADYLDVLRDLAGILIALGVCASIDPRLSRPGKAERNHLLHTVIPALTVCLCIVSSYPLAALAFAYHEREQAFPVIIDLTAHWSRPFLTLQHAILEQVTDPSACMAPPTERLARLQLEPVRYAGISVIEPHPDWTGYDQLVLEVFSAHPAPLELTLRIHDTRHDQSHSDRFNRVLTLSPGENRLRIPLAQVMNAPAGRQMDMSGIAGITLFSVNANSPVAFCTGVLRLE